MYANVYSKMPAGPVIVEPVAGDLNADGKADLADVRLLRDHLLTAGKLSETQAAASDPDGSGTLTAADLTLLKRLILTAE